MVVLYIMMLVLFCYLSLCVMYALVYSIAGKARMVKALELQKTMTCKKFAVLLPCYKEDAVILNSAKEALNQTYPADCYDVIVIADSLMLSTIDHLRRMPVRVIEVSFDVSTKAKSLNKALEVLPEIYDYALVLDADNIMAEDFIEKLNAVLESKCAKAVQGHRVAKNLNTDFAILDAISEEVNNHIYRKGHRALGLSSGLIGSGMAFDYKYFKKVMLTNKAIGGFDKELELKLLRDKIKIEYAEDAFVYDEKVENPEVFGNQRRRWISAQLYYFREYFWEGAWHLISKGNIDFFDKAFQQFLMPRVLLLGTTGIFTFMAFILEFVFTINFYPDVNLWMLLLFLNVTGLLIAIPPHYYNRKTLQAVLLLPKALVVMFLTLFKLRGANKKFIHTPHSGSIKNV